MSKVIGLIIVIIVIVGGIFLFKGKTSAPTTDNMAEMDMTVDTTATSSMATSTGTMTEDNVREFTLDASNFKFSLANISVKKGDKVRLIVKDMGGTHNLKIDEFNVETKMLQTGDSDVVEFVADKTGSFVYYCSVGSHRAMGMWGTLTVE